MSRALACVHLLSIAPFQAGSQLLRCAEASPACQRCISHSLLLSRRCGLTVLDGSTVQVAESECEPASVFFSPRKRSH